MKTQNETQHTPTPYYNGSTNRESANIVSADTVIAYVYDRNDRAFIVRAVNSHAQLVAALEMLTKALYDSGNHDLVCLAREYIVARAALQSAKE